MPRSSEDGDTDENLLDVYDSDGRLGPQEVERHTHLAGQ
jgi:hypothetical protein